MLVNLFLLLVRKTTNTRISSFVNCGQGVHVPGSVVKVRLLT